MNPLTEEFRYTTGAAAHTHEYLWQPVIDCLKHQGVGKVFDLGCGNGAFARHLTESGFSVTGVDPSKSGIVAARQANTEAQLEAGDAYEDLAARFGRFGAVVSLEVVEHVYYPRKYASTVAALLKPGGIALISTPYHGYLKNLALALSGAMDRHFTALWDHGHIKFWSIKTLSQLFEEVGLEVTNVQRLGRLPCFAKSMLMTLRKPAQHE